MTFVPHLFRRYWILNKSKRDQTMRMQKCCMKFYFKVRRVFFYVFTASRFAGCYGYRPVNSNNSFFSFFLCFRIKSIIVFVVPRFLVFSFFLLLELICERLLTNLYFLVNFRYSERNILKHIFIIWKFITKVRRKNHFLFF